MAVPAYGEQLMGAQGVLMRDYTGVNVYVDCVLENAAKIIVRIVETVIEIIVETVIETLIEIIVETVIETLIEIIVETVIETIVETVSEIIVETAIETAVGIRVCCVSV